MYTPLQFISKSENAGHEFEARKQQFIEMGCQNLSDMTANDFIRFVLSSDFFSPDYKGKYKDINILLASNSQSLFEHLHMNPQQFAGFGYDIKTEWKDIYLAPCLTERWSKNKQVYKPDPDFADALLTTEKLQLVKYQLEHLPCNDFYIDLESCIQFDPVIGIFVHVDTTATCAYVSLYLLTKELVFFSFYGGGEYDENGIIDIRLEDMPLDKTYDIFMPLSKNQNGPRRMEYKLSRSCSTIFALQMLCYISSSKPEILENPVTQKTYRKTDRVKNKFSEIRQWDVGVTYGKTIRRKVKEQEEKKSAGQNTAAENGQKNELLIRMNEGKKRKSPCMHYRSAHWQHYWTGKGRTVCETRWIAGTFVGDEAANVVIHKVK